MIPAYTTIIFCSSASHTNTVQRDSLRSHSHSAKGPSLLSQERVLTVRTLPEEFLDQIIPDLSQSRTVFKCIETDD